MACNIPTPYTTSVERFQPNDSGVFKSIDAIAVDTIALFLSAANFKT